MFQHSALDQSNVLCSDLRSQTQHLSVTLAFCLCLISLLSLHLRLDHSTLSLCWDILPWYVDGYMTLHYHYALVVNFGYKQCNTILHMFKVIWHYSAIQFSHCASVKGYMTPHYYQYLVQPLCLGPRLHDTTLLHSSAIVPWPKATWHYTTTQFSHCASAKGYMTLHYYTVQPLCLGLRLHDTTLLHSSAIVPWLKATWHYTTTQFSHCASVKGYMTLHYYTVQPLCLGLRLHDTTQLFSSAIVLWFQTMWHYATV